MLDGIQPFELRTDRNILAVMMHNETLGLMKIVSYIR